MAKRAFISFDYDHDEDLKNLLVGQAKNPDTPFNINDWSVKDPFTGDWRAQVRAKMKLVEIIVIVCGEQTDTATGVSVELAIAQEEGIPYFFLWGRSGKDCKYPKGAKASDKIYSWTWDNLKALIGGGR